MNSILCKHGETAPGMVPVTLQRGETTVILEGVPASVCDNCGEYYLHEDVASQVYAMAERAVQAGPGRRAVALLFAMVLGAGCAPRHEGPLSPPLLLERPAPSIRSEPCEPSGEPVAPSGRTPPPVAQGELALLEVRGDDRLGFVGHFVSAWSSDGERLITATEHGILIWKTRTGELERILDLGALIPQAVVLSPDEQWIAVSGSTSVGGAASVWLIRASGETPAQRFPGIGGELQFTPDGRRMFTNGHAWDLPAGTHTATTPIGGMMRLLPDGRRALVFVPRTPPSPFDTYFPELRDIGTGRTLHRFPAVDSSIRVALSGDGQRIAVLDGSLSVFSTATFERVAHVTHLEGASMVHLSHDGRRAVVETLKCAGFDGGGRASAPQCPSPHLAVWDLDRAERIFRGTRDAGDGWVFSRDGRFLTGTDWRLFEAIIRVEDGAVLEYGTRIRSISPNARWVLFEAQSGLELASPDGSGAPPSFSRAPRVLARSGDGRFTAAVGNDGNLRIEGATTCIRLGMTTSRRHDERVPHDHFDPNGGQVAFSPDAASLFTVVYDDTTPLFRAFRTSDGTERWSIRSVGQGAAAAYVLPGAGQVLFQGHGRAEVRRFDATTGAELLAGHAPRTGYVTPASGGGAFEVRDLQGARTSHAGRVTALAFTKQGDRLASAAEDGTVLLVDTANGAVVGRARLPLDRAEYLWVSPDGRELWAETARAMRVRFRIER
ncbi:YgiT-type zinc finger protein [Polyangium aurulentum]|uniref:YgiT-type zinc finger protein n=1 Tax=Polyangium aurulentum TaxID=2567896 RepID=UPI00146F2546|nr:YgiT-type zinc finger protein [Polyangium aurulentum]UQA63078.1 YgiT-type zinc finger protein [Polyangium aurulentum]